CDEAVAQRLHHAPCSVTLLVNKVDNLEDQHLIVPFYTLGFEEVIAVSATHGNHLAELWERLPHFPSPKQKQKEAISIAILGRPNVGKSTWINAALGEDRCLVSEVAGTTRDRVEIPLNYQNQRIHLIDTAGIRKKKEGKSLVEALSLIRTREALHRADLTLCLLDVTQEIGAQDKHIIRMIEEAGKGCLLFFNKWDQIQGQRMEHWLQKWRQQLPFLNHQPIIAGSAKEGRNVMASLDRLIGMGRALKSGISTTALNQALEEAFTHSPPPAVRGKRLKLYYTTQVKAAPPTFLCFVNHPSLVAPHYKRYLANRLHEAFPHMEGLPIHTLFKGKEKRYSGTGSH
ncbi:MAG: ribosome biogenesis GTPase Der, partial [Chlamydiota bacterium]|nr:ribosome biogenesis GTPase Der [Chlamydiota bacterium]